tara:strand:+ start:1053 stop:2078 length:1026 start_codon:yes stop_codon:yes gene_type:complete
MKPIIKFSKPSIAVIKNKKSFFEENEKHLSHVQSVNTTYKKQPLRKFCKTCQNPIGNIDIIVQNVEYSSCLLCGHFNGLYEDTLEFAKSMYANEEGKTYAKNYLENYNARVEDIYLPKVDFLIEVLKNDGIEKNISLLDVGCGGGHFVKACEMRELSAIGYDTNQELIKLGSEKITNNKLEYRELENIDELIKNNESEVLSLVGVLEHLMNPIDALQAFVESKAKYLYLQVPLFSLSVLLESMNPEVFPRQMNAGHTHLYTDKSINFLCEKFKLDKIGEWWFGTDMVDLYRHLQIKVASQNNIKKKDLIDELFGNFIDVTQNSLDRKKLCSGVNMVIKKSS